MLAHSIESGPKGSATKQKMTVDKYEANVDVAENSFAMPAVAKTDSSAAATAKTSPQTATATQQKPDSSGDGKGAPATAEKKK